jgi:hypothetical protein
VQGASDRHELFLVATTFPELVNLPHAFVLSYRWAKVVNVTCAVLRPGKAEPSAPRTCLLPMDVFRALEELDGFLWVDFLSHLYSTHARAHMLLHTRTHTHKTRDTTRQAHMRHACMPNHACSLRRTHTRARARTHVRTHERAHALNTLTNTHARTHTHAHMHSTLRHVRARTDARLHTDSTRHRPPL